MMDEEYFAKLIWLKDTEIITEKEFENFKKDFEFRKLF